MVQDFEEIWAQQDKLQLFHDDPDGSWNKIFAKYVWNIRSGELKDCNERIDDFKYAMAATKRQHENTKSLLAAANLRLQAYETLLRGILDGLEDIKVMQEEQNWASSLISVKMLYSKLDKIVLMPKIHSQNDE